MSVVIAKRTKNGFIFGADSQATRGHLKEGIDKIFKAYKEDNIYIGVVGSGRDCDLMKVMTEILDINAIRREQLTEESIISYTIPKIKEYLKKNDRHLIDKEGTACWDSSIMIVYKDKAFEIASDFSVTEVEDFGVIGAPMLEATGAYKILKQTNSKLSDFDMTKEIIKMTIDINNTVDYPIRMIDTSKDKDFTVIYRDKEVLK